MAADQQRPPRDALVAGSAFFWTTISQVASSAGNALFILGTARRFGGVEFYEIGLLATIHATSLGFLRASVGDRVLASRDRAPKSEFAVTLAIAAVVGAIILVVGAVTSNAVFVVSGLAFPVLLLQDTYRYSLFRNDRAQLAALGDGTWTLIVLIGLIALSQSDVQPVVYVVLWVLGAALSLVVVERVAELRPLVLPDLGFLGDRSVPLRFYLGDWLIGSGSILVLVHVLSAMESEASSSGFRLAWTIYGIAAVVHLAGIVVSTTSWSAGNRRLGPIGLTSGAVMTMAVLLLAISAWVPDGFAEQLIGQQWADTRPFMLALFPLFFGMGISSGAIGALRGAARADRALRVRVASFALGAASLLVARTFLDLVDAVAIGGAVIALANIGYWREVIRVGTDAAR